MKPVLVELYVDRIGLTLYYKFDLLGDCNVLA